MITQEDILKISRLSFLELSEEESKKYFKELSNVVDFFRKLEKINTKNIEPLLSSSLEEDIVFMDKVVLPLNQDKIIKNAPDSQSGFLKTKSFSK
jgi:aspartyl-tRNA(Asn)/glutamyl-tRNA(Gln) amidotransferase subunit C